jgi:hypothetical protein
MEKQIPRGLKITFLVHVIVAGIFGLVFLLIPDMYAKLTGLPVQDWAMSIGRMLGATQFGFAASSWLAYKETLWERVKVVVQMEVVWNILGTLAAAYGVIFGGFPFVYWTNVVIMAAFAVAFSMSSHAVCTSE